ncbi:hypothetical protein HZA38_06380 [Candidatus Peregrinibacteria bacterium]|nr:hypothetical protein [Candidatus Peregrinibacteria bacterium]
MDSTTLIGTTGATIVLIAFILSQFRIWNNEYFIYDFCNFLGSALLVCYALLLSSLPFLILNAVWAIVSLKDVYTDLVRNSKRKECGFYEKWMK